jgi:acyl dehydratase
MKNHAALAGTVVNVQDHAYTVQDTMLYALGLGLGTDPVDARQLRYVYEDGLVALPTLALVLAYPGFWMREPRYGFDWHKVLHAEEALEVHAALPVAGTVHGETVIEDVIDRGADKGCFVYLRKTLRAADGTLLATVVSNTLARGDGGFGGSAAAPRPPLPAPPARAPDAVCDLATLPQQALLYRLSGDMNPLHADPAIARAAGFERPILHGRCTLGVAVHALLRHCCDYDASRLRSLAVRFSAPFLPGETLRTELWREGDRVFFRASARERGVQVLSHGSARVDV